MIYPLVASLNPPSSLNFVERLSCPLVHTDSYPYARKIPKRLKESSMVNEYPRSLATRDVFPPTNPWCLLLKTHLWLTFRGWHILIVSKNVTVRIEIQCVSTTNLHVCWNTGVPSRFFFLLFKSYTYIYCSIYVDLFCKLNSFVYLCLSVLLVESMFLPILLCSSILLLASHFLHLVFWLESWLRQRLPKRWWNVHSVAEEKAVGKPIGTDRE